MSVHLETAFAYVFGTLAGLLLAWVVWEFTCSPLHHFPGPIPARLTDAWRFAQALSGKADESQRRMHRRFGAVARIGPNTLMLNDPDLIKTVYGVKRSWRKSNMYHPNDALMDGYRIPNLFSSRDEEWYDKYKRPVGGLFTLSKVLDMEHLVDETLIKFDQKLEADYFKGKTASDKVIMMDEWMTYFAWDANMNTIHGKHYGFIDEGRDVNNQVGRFKAGITYFHLCTQMPWLDSCLDKNPFVRIGPKLMSSITEFSARMVAAYRSSLEQVEKTGEPATSGSQGHLIEQFFNTKTAHPDIINEQQIVNYTLLVVGAGGDSTAATFCSVVYHLGKEPSSYAKLREEIDGSDLKTPVSWADASKLPYLDGVIREAMRLCPGIPMVLEREVPAGGFRLPDGRFIPAGTKVGMNPAVTNRDAGVFGEEPDRFVPERWLRAVDEGEDAYVARRKRMAEVFDFTFGAGKRACLGRNLARMVLWKSVATFYTWYDMKLDNVAHEWDCQNHFFAYRENVPMIIRRRRS